MAAPRVGVRHRLVVLAVGVGVPLLILVSNSDNHAKRGAGGVDLTAAQADGRELFAENCSTCHTLAGSSAVGRVGPNLDTLNGGNLKPAFVLDAIDKGRARGTGQMPAGLLYGAGRQGRRRLRRRRRRPLARRRAAHLGRAVAVASPRRPRARRQRACRTTRTRPRSVAGMSTGSGRNSRRLRGVPSDACLTMASVGACHNSAS